MKEENKVKWSNQVNWGGSIEIKAEACVLQIGGMHRNSATYNELVKNVAPKEKSKVK